MGFDSSTHASGRLAHILVRVRVIFPFLLPPLPPLPPLLPLVLILLFLILILLLLLLLLLLFLLSIDYDVSED